MSKTLVVIDKGSLQETVYLDVKKEVVMQVKLKNGRNFRNLYQEAQKINKNPSLMGTYQIFI